MKNLRNKVVLLTGATGGLGSAMTRALLEEGALLILTDLSEDALKDVVEAPRTRGPDRVLGTIAADLSRREECERLVYEAEEIASRVDLLINNAGIGHVGDLTDIPAEKMEVLMELNTMAPMRLTRALLPGMHERGQGHIVFISSLAGVVGLTNLAAYSASKFAVHGFAQAMRGDLESHGIRVSGVYPSFTNTNFLNSQRFGVNREATVPEFLLDDPEVVARNIIKGIKSDRARILPSFRARLTWVMNRLSPELVRRSAVYLRRRLLGDATNRLNSRLESASESSPR